MLFHSIQFLFVFLPIAWIGFFLLVRAGRIRGVVAWLTFASMVFYAWWNPPYVFLIGASILMNYGIGRWVCPKTSSLRFSARAALLAAGLIGNVGALAYFKYANFFVENLNLVLHTGFNLEKVILPLAISFFTFQQIAYLVDAFRGDTHGYTFLEYAFFVSFFPQLIAGPIVQHHEVLPQIARERWKPVRWENLQVGLTIFAIGLFKKMVLADGSAEFATPIFTNAAAGFHFPMTDAWIGALAYSFQLYFDFSGYSDMAIGLGRCFGIVLPLNFNSPYKATSIIDFWRRWHITLSRFLRNYVYIPLGGNRKGVLFRYSNVMITMLIGGLWHGAGWTFVIWGGLHGLYLVINHGFRAATGGLFARSGVARVAFAPVAWAITMLAVVVGWVFFRSADLPTAWSLLTSMFAVGGAEATPLTPELKVVLEGPLKFLWIGALAALALFAPSTHDYLRDHTPALGVEPAKGRKWPPRWRPTFVHGMCIGAMLFLVVRRYFQLAPTEFLYFNF